MTTAHIRASTYASETLRRMAKASNTTIAAALDTVLRERERYDYFAAAAETYAALSDAERQTLAAETEAWDETLADGLPAEEGA